MTDFLGIVLFVLAVAPLVWPCARPATFLESGRPTLLTIGVALLAVQSVSSDFMGIAGRWANLLAVLCHAAVLIRYHPAFKPEVLEHYGPSTWRLLMANVEMTNQDKEAVKELINRAECDVVVLEEVDEDWREAIECECSAYTTQVWQEQSNYYGIAVLSKVPLSNVDIRYARNSEQPSLHMIVDGRFELHCFHPQPPPLVEVDEREREFKKIDNECERPRVLVGDLNDVNWSVCFRRRLRELNLKDPRIGRGVYTTHHARQWFRGYPLDHVLVSEEFKVAEYRVGPYVGSDHYPVLVGLTLEEGSSGPGERSVSQDEIQPESEVKGTRLRRSVDSRANGRQEAGRKAP